MKKLCLIFILLISPITYSGEFYINGITDCGTWYEGRSKGGASNLEAFVQGYVNGAVMATGVEIWHAKGVVTSPQALYLFVDNYCKSNPLESIVSASWDFINKKTNNAFFKQHKN